MSFSTGDVVRLKSDGPDMTVEKVMDANQSYDYERAICVWFVGGEKKQDVFATAAIEMAE